LRAFYIFFIAIAALWAMPKNACAQPNPIAYVPNNNGTLSVIDSQTNTVVATIPSGFNHPFCASVSPNGKLLYVCSEDNSIKVVDTKTNTITASISLPGAIGFIGNEGAGPSVAFTSNSKLAYVITSGGGVNSTLYAINTGTNTVVSSTSFGRTFLLAVAVSPNSKTIYLATEAPILSQSGILVVDADGKTPTQTIAVGHIFFDLALGRDGDRLYASDVSGLIGGQSGVRVIDTHTNSIVATVPLPNNTFVTGLALTPDGGHLYAADFTLTNPPNSTITVIDTNDNSIDATIVANGQTLTALAATDDKILAVNSVLSVTTDSTVDVIGTATNTIVGSITVQIFPISIATQPPESN
jgi:YVTN family beta-propeller protein